MRRFRPTHASRTASPAARLRRVASSQPGLAIAIVGIACLYAGTRAALLWRFPPFWDEAQNAAYALDVFRDPLHPLGSLTIGKPPLLMWLGSTLIALGAGPLTAVRLVSGAAGAVTMVALGLLGARLAGAWTGVLAAGLYAVLPFTLVHGGLGLVEPLVMAALTSAVYLQIRLAQAPAARVAVLLGVAMAAGLLAKESAALALFLLPFSALFVDWQAANVRARVGTWLKHVALALAVTGAGYALIRLSPSFDSYSTYRPQLVRSLGDALGHPVGWFHQHWPVYRAAIDGYMTVPLLAAGAVGVAVALARRPACGVLLLAWLGAALAAAIVFPRVPYPRYLAVAMPAALLLVAVGLCWAGGQLTRRAGALGRAAAVVGLVAALVPALRLDARVLAHPDTARYPGIDDEQYVTGMYAGTGWPALASQLERHAGQARGPVAWDGVFSWALPLIVDGRRAWTVQDLNGSRFSGDRFGFLPSTSISRDRRLRAPTDVRFLVANWHTRPAIRRGFVLVGVYQRPHGGTWLGLYERAA
jgi:4-amino-4-deoxy-L-arabinose transferase-like glycosyltransferase